MRGPGILSCLQNKRGRRAKWGTVTQGFIGRRLLRVVLFSAAALMADPLAARAQDKPSGIETVGKTGGGTKYQGEAVHQLLEKAGIVAGTRAETPKELTFGRELTDYWVETERDKNGQLILWVGAYMGSLASSIQFHQCAFPDAPLSRAEHAAFQSILTPKEYAQVNWACPLR